jgi:hypothetical protein
MADSESESDDSVAALSSDSDEGDREVEDANAEHEIAAAMEEEKEEVVPEDAVVEWSNHPARKILKDALINGDIPTNYNREGGPNYHIKPKMIYATYKNTDAFAGMTQKQFTSRLNALRKIVERRNKRVLDDMHAFEIFRHNFPIHLHNHQGELRWEGSEAQTLLKEDIEMGRHLEYDRTRLFWLSRPEYQQFKRKVFLGHIDQEKRLQKLKTLQKQEKKKKKKKKRKVSIGSGSSSSNSSDE